MNIPRSLKSTFILYSANIFTLLLAWVVTKLNVTYLTVTEFGQFTFFLTVINTIYIFFTLGIFESAARLAALSDTDIQYRRNVGASLTLALLAYSSFTIIFWAIHWLIDSVFEVKISHLMLYFFPLAGAYLFFDFWQKVLRGAGKIPRLSWFITLPRLIYLACLAILVLVNRFDLLTTTLFNLVGFLAVSIFYIFLEKPDFSALSQSISRLKAEVKRFGIHIYWSELIAAFLLQSDKLFIAFFLDADQLAFYSLAFTVTLPLSLFSTSLSTSLYRGFSRDRQINKKTLWLNGIWVAVSIAILIIFRKWIILRLFSEKYTPSLTVFPVLAVAFGTGGLGKLYTFYLTAQGAGKAIRNISIIIVICSILLNIILIPTIGILGAAISRLVTYTLDFGLLLFFYRRHQKIKTADLR